jgi:hypothetical protein
MEENDLMKKFTNSGYLLGDIIEYRHIPNSPIGNICGIDNDKIVVSKYPEVLIPLKHYFENFVNVSLIQRKIQLWKKIKHS